jgi:hypothetical protein
MGLQAIEATPKNENPVFELDQNAGDMSATHWAVGHSVSSHRKGASSAFSPTHWLMGSKMVEGSRAIGRVAARASAAVGACVLWLFIGTVGTEGLCGESNARPQAFDFLRGRQTSVQRLDEMQGNAAQAPQSDPAGERKPVLKREQEWDRAEALAQTLTSSLRAELDAVRSTAEAARIKQRQALDQEQDRADTLARELASLRAELDTARIVGQEAVQATEAEIKQTQALEQERGRADTLARELTSLRAELDAARIGGLDASQAATAGIKQTQALEQERGRADTLARELASVRAELDAERIVSPEAAQATAVEQMQALDQELQQERDRSEALARELTSLRAKIDTVRAAGVEAGRTAEAAKIEQERALGEERDRRQALARELTSARKQVEERSALLAAAHAEVLQVIETNSAAAAEQRQALASERERAEALARELASVTAKPEVGNWQIAALNAFQVLNSHEFPQERMAESRTIEGKGRSPEQISGQTVGSNSERSSATELPPPAAQAIAGEAKPDSDPKVAMGTERSTSAGAPSRAPVDEERLLARATALLRQADISGARPLLEHALDKGSARAAFMLAETYDARVLQSWRARGIPGDLAKARELYERAQAGGVEDARERIKTLK